MYPMLLRSGYTINYLGVKIETKNLKKQQKSGKMKRKENKQFVKLIISLANH